MGVFSGCVSHPLVSINYWGDVDGVAEAGARTALPFDHRASAGTDRSSASNWAVAQEEIRSSPGLLKFRAQSRAVIAKLPIATSHFRDSGDRGSSFFEAEQLFFW